MYAIRSYYVWTKEPSKTADSDAQWNIPTAGNCSNLNCHNGKATSSTSNFTWYGTGTQNCVLCHNDITDTAAGTTGETHDAHVGTPIATFGKVITCGNCHGGNPSWTSYAVPSINHINGTFAVADGSVIDGTIKSYNFV